MFLKTNLGYLSQIALKNMQLLIHTDSNQVIPGHGNSQKRMTMFIGYSFNIVPLIIKNFTKYLKTHPSE